MKVDYDDRQHRTYATGRVHSDETRALWNGVLTKHLSLFSQPRILDLGCGVGRFSPMLAECCGGCVVGVEPSEKMLRQAIEQAAHPRVEYIAGEAERIPALDDAFDCAFLSMVVHHFDDLAGTASEIARVLKPGGLVLIRNCFSGRLDSIECYRWLPEVKAIDERRMPSVEQLCATFAEAGFEFIALETIRQMIDESLMAHYERLDQRAVSTFELLPEEVIDAGLERMRRAAEREESARPITEDIDLLTLRLRR